MFCDGCGSAVQPGQAFCSRCGKQVVGPVTVMQMLPGRVQGHVHLLGIVWLAIGVQYHRRRGALYSRQHTVCSSARTRGAGGAHQFSASTVECGRHFCSGQGSLRVHRRMGLAAARTVGSHYRSGSGFHRVVQHSLRYGRRRLHSVGLIARAIGTRIWRHRRRSRRISDVDASAIFFLRRRACLESFAVPARAIW